MNMKNEYKELSIKTHTKEDKLAVYHLLHNFTQCPITVMGFKEPNPRLHQMDMDYPVLYIKHDYTIGSRVREESKYPFEYPEDISKIIDFFTNPNPPKVYEVNDVAGYTAKINNVGIAVGCQTITFEKFQEISDKVDEFKKDKH
jgi:hypothetical protein